VDAYDVAVPFPTVSAVLLARDRPRETRIVLDRLAEEDLLEILVVDNSDGDGPARVIEEHPAGARTVGTRGNVGIAGRNAAARAARGDLLLMLDDDAYPTAGAVEHLRRAFAAHPRLGVAGGLVRDVGPGGEIVQDFGVGSFDWFLRAGRDGSPPEGLPAFFFPEGACMARREAYLEAGGFFEPFFFACTELELTARLTAAGWEVRYFPSAPFDHMKAQAGRLGASTVLHHRIRNQLWYFWLRFPRWLAARRIPAYLAFDLVECVIRRTPTAWTGAIADAWRGRGELRRERAPLPRTALRRAELNRGRLHVRLLALQARRRLRGLLG